MQVQGNAILIKPDKIPERTSTGLLVIPKTSKEMAPEWGEVIEAGPACEEIKKGMRVLFPLKQASIIVIDDQDFYFVYEYNIKYYE